MSHDSQRVKQADTFNLLPDLTYLSWYYIIGKSADHILKSIV